MSLRKGVEREMNESNLATRSRIAEYFHVVFTMLVANGGSMPRTALLAELPKRISLNTDELGQTSNGLPRWQAKLEMRANDFQQAGFLERRNDAWSLTEEGRRAFAAHNATALFDLARERYIAWRKSIGEAEVGDEDALPAAMRGNRDASVWLIGTGRDGSLWERFRTRGEARIGFTFEGTQLGCLTEMSRAEINARVRELSGEPKPWNIQLACWEFAHAMKEGELVIARTGFDRVLGIGRVAGPYQYDPDAADYAHSRKIDWFWTGERRMPERARLHPKTLTDISRYPEIMHVVLGVRSQAAVSYLSSLGHDSAAIDRYFAAPPVLAGDDAIGARAAAAGPPSRPFSEVFESRFPAAEALNSMVDELDRKKAIILQGPPGTGKTYIANQLANYFVEHPMNVMRVQFHPAYSYEDFIRGIRPSTHHFEIADGPLIQIARQAMERPKQHFVLLIDEFNRGNVARILGETLSLIEADKREQKYAVRLPLGGVPLPGGDGHSLWLPENLYIVGTMNTADRSIALVDHALRRRFAFIDLKPAFDDPEFTGWLSSELGGDGEQEGNSSARGIAERVTRTMLELNSRIAKSALLGEGHCLGHSYFCGDTGSRDLTLWARTVFEKEIKPQLREYCADDPKLGRDLLEIASAFDA